MNRFIKLNSGEMIKFLILSLLILLIPIIGYFLDLRVDNIWWATFVTQLGVGLIWLFIKMGLFHSPERPKNRLWMNSYQKNNLDFKNEKKLNEKVTNQVVNKRVTITSKQGAYAMILTSLIYLIVALIVSYA